MFSWLYLKTKKELAVDRDHAYAIFRLAELTRCMPGAVAQVGPSSSAMARLLAEAVGDGREIFLIDESGDRLQAEPSPRMLSTLPGLADQAVERSGLRHVWGGLAEAERLVRPGQRFCFVHVLGCEPVGLQRSLAFFVDRLSACGMLLLEVPEDIPAEEFSGALGTLLSGRREKIVPLKTRHCLVINVPVPPVRRLDTGVRIRQQGYAPAA